MSASILESLTAAEEARAEAARQAYSDLVAQLGSGTEDVSLSDVQQILAAAGSTASQLTYDVADYKRELGLRDTVVERDAALIEREDINRSIEESAAKAKAATEAHQRFCYPLQVRLNEIQQLIQRGAEADQALVRRGNENWIKE